MQHAQRLLGLGAAASALFRGAPETVRRTDARSLSRSARLEGGAAGVRASALRAAGGVALASVGPAALAAAASGAALSRRNPRRALCSSRNETKDCECAASTSCISAHTQASSARRRSFRKASSRAARRCFGGSGGSSLPSSLRRRSARATKSLKRRRTVRRVLAPSSACTPTSTEKTQTSGPLNEKLGIVHQKDMVDSTRRGGAILASDTYARRVGTFALCAARRCRAAATAAAREYSLRLMRVCPLSTLDSGHRAGRSLVRQVASCPLAQACHDFGSCPFAWHCVGEKV